MHPRQRRFRRSNRARWIDGALGHVSSDGHGSRRMPGGSDARARPVHTAQQLVAIWRVPRGSGDVARLLGADALATDLSENNKQNPSLWDTFVAWQCRTLGPLYS